MSQVEIRLPKMGESVTEANITNWIKGVGDTIEIDEPLVEVATDKVDNKLPSEVTGSVAKIFFEVDEIAQVGDVIALMSTNGEVADDTKEENTEVEKAAEVIDQTVNDAVAAVHTSGDLDKNGPSGKFYSPLVRSIAEKEGIAMNELESIKIGRASV